MAIYLDDQPVELAGADLAAVLEAANARLQDGGRFVVEVRRNGETLLGDELTRSLVAAVGDHEIHLISAEPRALLRGALHDVRALLGRVQELQQSAADLLQEDKVPQAMRALSELIEHWQQAHRGLIDTLAVLGDADLLNSVTVEGESLVAITESTVAQLRQLHELVKAQDTVGLADALRYEWPQTTGKWDKLVAILINRLESTPGPGPGPRKS